MISAIVLSKAFDDCDKLLEESLRICVLCYLLVFVECMIRLPGSTFLVRVTYTFLLVLDTHIANWSSRNPWKPSRRAFIATSASVAPVPAFPCLR